MGGVLEGDIPAGKRCSCAIVLFVAADAVHLLVGEVEIGDIPAPQAYVMRSVDLPPGLTDLANGIVAGHKTSELISTAGVGDGVCAIAAIGQGDCPVWKTSLATFVKLVA